MEYLQSTLKRSQESTSSHNEGKWSQDEHNLFRLAYEQHKDQWEIISQIVKSRTISQVRSHAQKYFNRLASDKEKIGNQKVQVRGQNDIAITRCRSTKTSKHCQSMQPSFRQSETTSPQQIKRKYERNVRRRTESLRENKKQKSKSERMEEISEVKMQVEVPVASSECKIQRDSNREVISSKIFQKVSGSERIIVYHDEKKESGEQFGSPKSYFMETIYPRMDEFPDLRSFCIFSLVDWADESKFPSKMEAEK